MKLSWKHGNSVHKSCSPADACALYFDGIVQEVQLTSSVGKQFVFN